MESSLYLAEALAKARVKFKKIVRNRKVEVRSTKGNYTFNYAEYERVAEAIQDALCEQGIAWTHEGCTRDGLLGVETKLLYKDQMLTSFVPIDWEPGNGNQSLGSAKSYARRYGLIDVLGLAAEDDDDANIADGNAMEERGGAKKAEPKKINPDVRHIGRLKEIKPPADRRPAYFVFDVQGQDVMTSAFPSKLPDGVTKEMFVVGKLYSFMFTGQYNTLTHFAEVPDDFLEVIQLQERIGAKVLEVVKKTQGSAVDLYSKVGHADAQDFRTVSEAKEFLNYLENL